MNICPDTRVPTRQATTNSGRKRPMFSSKTCAWKTGSLRTAPVRSTMNATMIAMACLFFSPASHAQGPKGAAAVAPDSPAAQFHAHLRGSVQGRTSPKIVNPQAPNFDNSAIIAVCRNQKQTADREAQQLFGDGSVKPTAAMGDGSVRKGITDGTSHASKDPGPPGRLPAVQS